MAGTKYSDLKHLLSALVQFHLDLSWHLYAIRSSGTFERFPRFQVVAEHLGEGLIAVETTRRDADNLVAYLSICGKQAIGSTTPLKVVHDP